MASLAILASLIILTALFIGPICYLFCCFKWVPKFLVYSIGLFLIVFGVYFLFLPIPGIGLIILFFGILTLRSRRKVNVSILSTPRSSKWRKIRILHLDKNPSCVVCGSLYNVVPHHIFPVHSHPEKELELDNLVSLCENKSFNCHLFFGHLKNWTKNNINVKKDAEYACNMLIQNEKNN